MAPKGSKQAQRNSAKKKVEEPASLPMPAGDVSLVELAKALVFGSCIVETAPKLPALLKDEISRIMPPKEKEGNGAKEAAEEKKESEPAETNGDAETKENGNGDAKEEGAEEIFAALKGRLAWHNALGLQANAEESVKAWLAMKGQEFDWGPRAKRRGSPGAERVSLNLGANMSQYVHLLVALMMLRAFLFRSFFACLPWLFFYQLVSLLLPLTSFEKLPQVPLEKVPTKYRVAGTVAIHALIWLFFLYELVWKTYFFEKIPLVGLIVYHAYAVRPADAWAPKSK